MTAEDINIGIGALLETFEMMYGSRINLKLTSIPVHRSSSFRLFGFLHVKAFSYKPYRMVSEPDSKESTSTRTPRLKSLACTLI